MTRSLSRWLATPLLLALVTALLTPSLSFAQRPQPPAPKGPPTQFVPGEILVQFKPGTPGQAVADAHRQNQGQSRDIIPGIDVHIVNVPPGQELVRAAAYERNPNVEYAELNGFYAAIGMPSDSRVSEQWQYDNTGQFNGTPDADIDAFAAWDTTLGNPDVIIAILDSGIDQSHEDLTSKIRRNVNYTRSRSMDDLLGHGTHVAGSAAASTNNGRGVAGTCPNCSLYNVKVLGDDGVGQWDWIAKGITWSANNGAKVVSMSLGGGYDSRTVQRAVDYAWSKGLIITAAAGNSGASHADYPALYANAIAVAATDNRDVKASFSNWGYGVDVAAPGVAILSTAPDHKNQYWPQPTLYDVLSGTSMATPHVAGIAGLVWSVGTCSTNACVRERIQRESDTNEGSLYIWTGTETIYGPGNQWDWGRVNAAESVNSTLDPWW